MSINDSSAGQSFRLSIGGVLHDTWRIFKRDWWKLGILWTLTWAIPRFLSWLGLFFHTRLPINWTVFFSGVRIHSFYWERLLIALPMVAVWAVFLSYLSAVSVNVVSRRRKLEGRRLLWLLKVGLKPLGWLVLWFIALAVVEWISKIPGYLAPLLSAGLLHTLVPRMVLGAAYLLFILFAMLVPFYLLRQRLPLKNAVSKNFVLIYRQFWRVLAAILVVTLISGIPVLIYYVYMRVYPVSSNVDGASGWIQVWWLLANVFIHVVSWCFKGALYLRLSGGAALSTISHSRRSHQVTCGS